jgi:hypothetical protein
VKGKPCSHALSFIATHNRDLAMDDYVHELYSVEMFRKAYASVLPPMTSKHLWSQVDLGYKIKKPKLRRKPGRPRVARIMASGELSKKRKRECTECHELGHTAKYGQGGHTSSQKKMRLSSNDPNAIGSTSK